MKTQALKGMRDLLPAEQTLRDYIQGKILETYRASGFERISTPMLEDMVAIPLYMSIELFPVHHIIKETAGLSIRMGTLSQIARILR